MLAAYDPKPDPGLGRPGIISLWRVNDLRKSYKAQRDGGVRCLVSGAAHEAFGTIAVGLYGL